MFTIHQVSGNSNLNEKCSTFFVPGDLSCGPRRISTATRWAQDPRISRVKKIIYRAYRPSSLLVRPFISIYGGFHLIDTWIRGTSCSTKDRTLGVLNFDRTTTGYSCVWDLDRKKKLQRSHIVKTSILGYHSYHGLPSKICKCRWYGNTKWSPHVIQKSLGTHLNLREWSNLTKKTVCDCNSVP